MSTQAKVASLTPSGRLCVIEQALYAADTGIGELKQLSDKRAKQLLGAIEERVPDLWRTICYIDVVFVLPTGAGGVSRGFVCAPSLDAVGRYNRLVEKMVGGTYDVAGHPVFRAGLPVLRFADGREETPTSLQELNELNEPNELGTFPSDVVAVQERYFELDFDPQAPVQPHRTVPSFHTQPWNIKRDNTEKKYGGVDRPVTENFDHYRDLLGSERAALSDASGRPLRYLAAVPASWWLRRTDGRYMLSAGGSFFLGSSRPMTADEKHAIMPLFAEATSAGYLAQEFARAGQRSQQASFAHQTSAVIDTIVHSIERLDEQVRKAMGGALLAKLHLLRATINSYRTEGSRADVGDFPYPWEEGQSPLAVYRDIGLQLGFARAQDGREPKVRTAGRAALRSDEPGSAGFEVYRAYFNALPDTNPTLDEYLKHSSFAVLILLALKQAVYHTLRANVLGKGPARITLAVNECGEGVAFDCTILNPRVTSKDEQLTSKDAQELADLAQRFSKVSGAKATYWIEGPYFDHSRDAWAVTTRIHFTATQREST
jgi:hypothetical protein